MRDYKKEAEFQKKNYFQHNIKLNATDEKRLKKILKKSNLTMIEFIRASLYYFDDESVIK